MYTELATQPDLIHGIAAALGDYDKVIPLATVQALDDPVRELGAGNHCRRGENSFWRSQRVDLLSFQQGTPSYSDVSGRPGYKEMDSLLQRAVREAEEALRQIPAAQRSWVEVLRAFQLCPLLVTSPEAPIDRADEFTFTRSNWFKKQAHYRSVAEDVRSWFTRFMLDLDLVTARGATDLEAIHGIVAHAGRIFNGNVIYKKERQQRTLLDIGVLRYPDINQPYIKVYRLELIAWYESIMVLGRAQDRNGIMAQFNLRQYQPDEKAIEALRESMLRLVVEHAEKQLPM